MIGVVLRPHFMDAEINIDDTIDLVKKEMHWRTPRKDIPWVAQRGSFQASIAMDRYTPVDDPLTIRNLFEWKVRRWWWWCWCQWRWCIDVVCKFWFAWVPLWTCCNKENQRDCLHLSSAVFSSPKPSSRKSRSSMETRQRTNKC